MKKLVLALAILVVAVSLFGGSFEVKNECVRVHIRANSNADFDQKVKYEVKDEVVRYLTPYISELTSSNDAKKVVEAKLSSVEEIAKKTLMKNGYSYGAKARLTKEEFPARCYDGYTLEEGVYDALIIELGEGKGDNWWCVLFPPLCFTPAGNGDTITYKSKIAELCEEIFGT